MWIRIKCEWCWEYKECPMVDLYWDWNYYCEDCIEEIEEQNTSPK